jgi:hypothetical protein
VNGGRVPATMIRRHARRFLIAGAQLALIALAVAACGTTGSFPVPREAGSTLMIGWESYFSLEWTAERYEFADAGDPGLGTLVDDWLAHRSSTAGVGIQPSS